MTEPRPSLYSDIHKAVRHILFELSFAAGQTDFAVAAEVEALRQRMTHAFTLLRSHAAHEDTFLDPLLAVAAPELLAELQRAHAEQHGVMDTLEAELATIDATRGALAEGEALRIKLTRYTAEQLQHMADEETLAMSALWRRYDDAQLHDVHMRLLQSVPPGEMAEWYRFLLPALPAAYRAGMLANIRAGAPAEVFADVLGVAQRALSAEAYADLEARLASDSTRAA